MDAVQATLGHARQATSERYAKLADERLVRQDAVRPTPWAAALSDELIAATAADDLAKLPFSEPDLAEDFELAENVDCVFENW